MSTRRNFTPEPTNALVEAIQVHEYDPDDAARLSQYLLSRNDTFNFSLDQIKKKVLALRAQVQGSTA